LIVDIFAIISTHFLNQLTVQVITVAGDFVPKVGIGFQLPVLIGPALGVAVSIGFGFFTIKSAS
jgi:hypothetical protein